MTALAEETRLAEASLEELAERLASLSPAPGAGTAAALPAALGAALVAMAARLTVAADPFSDLAFDLDAVAREADELRARLLGLADEDAAAFEGVIAARRAGDADEIRRAREAAADPPLHVRALALRVAELAADVAERGDLHVLPEARVARLFATASAEAAAVTVEALREH